MNKEDKHFNWKGQNVKYFGLHNWVRTKINRDKCESCGVLGKKYKNGSWSIECANKSGKYLRNTKDWFVLCRKCHRQYDNEKRGTEIRSCTGCKKDIVAVKGFRKKFCDGCLYELKKSRNRETMRLKRGFKGLTNSAFYAKIKTLTI